MRPAGLLLAGGQVLDPARGARGRLDLAVRDGRVAALGRDLPREGYESIDVTGKLVLPGLINQHAHFDLPGNRGAHPPPLCRSGSRRGGRAGAPGPDSRDQGAAAARRAPSAAQEFFPDTISSDLTAPGARGVVKDLSHTLSKFLNLGMPLEEVIRAATATPARAIGRAGDLGTLAPGAVADVAVFDLEAGAFEFEDADGGRLAGHVRLAPYLTITSGEIWWRRTG